MSTGNGERPAVLAEGLHKSFGETHALAGLDLCVGPGKVLGLLGPNGAGKTTTVRILSTLLVPDAGRAQVAGLDVVRDAHALRTRIGLTGQYAAVDKNLTGRENLEMFGRLYRLAHGAARARAEELLERFALTDAAGRVVKTYSGGMRRRLDLAASLIAKPPVLFLDEPTTGLDPRSRLAMWDLLAELVAGGTTLLLTTQYLDEADRLADRIAVIDTGKVIAEGTSDELKRQVGGERVEVTVARGASVQQAAEVLARHCDAEPHVDPELRRVSGAAAGGSARLAGVVRELDGAGVQLEDVGVRRPTLDDVFLALTGHEAEKPGAGLPVSAVGSRTARAPEPSVAGAPARESLARRLRWTANDILVLTERNLRMTTRVPELMAASLIQPIVFVLLFRYVFGGAIRLSGEASYVNYLMAGIFVQTTAFGAIATGIGLAHDLDDGLIDRFRSLPMSSVAVVFGRASADLLRNTIAIVVTLAVGIAVGFRPHGDLAELAAAGALLLIFSFAFSWLGACIGLALRNVEAVQAASFIWLLPFVFASSAFVPTATMPGWLRSFAEAQPISKVVDAIRAWTLDRPVGSAGWLALAWCVAALLVFVPLATRLFTRAASKP